MAGGTDNSRWNTEGQGLTAHLALAGATEVEDTPSDKRREGSGSTRGQS